MNTMVAGGIRIPYERIILPTILYSPLLPRIWSTLYFFAWYHQNRRKLRNQRNLTSNLQDYPVFSNQTITRRLDRLCRETIIYLTVYIGCATLNNYQEFGIRIIAFNVKGGGILYEQTKDRRQKFSPPFQHSYSEWTWLQYSAFYQVVNTSRPHKSTQKLIFPTRQSTHKFVSLLNLGDSISLNNYMFRMLCYPILSWAN